MKRILIQLDTDDLASSFDRVVAVDSGIDELFSYSGVTPANVSPLVHGAMFTRGPADLKHTAIFVGGSDVDASDLVFQKVQQTFFGPMRVSVMADANGSNTTAAAAVRSAARHVDISKSDALVLGGTGPVGRRIAQILASAGSHVRVASRTPAKAEQVCGSLKQLVSGAKVTPYAIDDDSLAAAVDGISLVFAAGAAGVQFLAADEWQSIDSLRVAIDLNAVPPLGLEGIEAADKGTARGEVTCYGALGIGSLKMKVHRTALQQLFVSNDLVLDTAAVYAIAEQFE